MMEVEQVYGLYGKSWKGLIVPEATVHPAKFSRKLVYWIVTQGLERGWWDYGDVILDPFAGVGLGGIVAADYYLRWIGVELEPRFYELAQQNLALNSTRWEEDECPYPLILRGDSRQLKELITPYIQGVISSPPYIDSIRGKDTEDKHRQRQAERYARGEFQSTRPDIFSSEKNLGAVAMYGSTYGEEEGQIGAMKEGKLAVITPPPFSHPDVGHRQKLQPGNVADAHGRSYTTTNQESPGNIARLSGITSPPYEKSLEGGSRHSTDTGINKRFKAEGRKPIEGGYSDAAENIGNQKGETYWDAVAQVYQQMYDLFQSGGHAAIVVKAFVRKFKVTDLPQMTLDLLTHIGFEPVAWIDTMLISPDKNKEHKAFFKRNYENMCHHRTAKNVDGYYQCKLVNAPCPFYKAPQLKTPVASPSECGDYLSRKMMGLAIDNEVVLVVRKP